MRHYSLMATKTQSIIPRPHALKNESMPSPSLLPVRPDLNNLIDIALATGGETDRFDFKELLDLTRDDHKLRLTKAIAAFANTDEGGYVLVGISDDRIVKGLLPEVAEAFDQTRVYAMVSQYLAPPPDFQVRHLERDGLKVIVIEVSSFLEVPCVVRKTVNAGKERLVAGTFLFRSKAARSGVLEAESDVRTMCDVLVKRRASMFLELVQRGTLSRPHVDGSGQFESAKVIEQRAAAAWPSASNSVPSLEVGFASEYDLAFSPEQTRAIIPAACVGIQHGFPFWHVPGVQVHESAAWGWYGRIPFGQVNAPDPRPEYLWLLSRAGAFLYREKLWEDDEGSVIPGGLGIFHVTGNVILLVRFLQNLTSIVALRNDVRFRIGVSAANIRGRYLEDEKRGGPSPFRKPSGETVVSSSVTVQVADLATRPREVVLNLLEEFCWQFGRDDWRRHHLEELIVRAPAQLGAEYQILDAAGRA